MASSMRQLDSFRRKTRFKALNKSHDTWCGVWGFGGWGLGFSVWGLGFGILFSGVWGLGFGA